MYILSVLIIILARHDKITVEIIRDRLAWDEFVGQSAYGLIFHKWDFLRIMEKHTGYELLPYGVYRGEELVCVFPLFYKKTMGLKRLYSPPQQSLTNVPYLGPVMGAGYDGLRQRRKESYLNGVVDEMHREITRLAPDYTSIALVPRFIDVRPFKWNGYDVDVHFTYFIDLKKPIEQIFSNLESKCRSNIKKCEKLGLTLMQVNDVDTFINIMKDRLVKQGLTYFQRQDVDYLVDLLEAFPDTLKMYFLYNGSDIVSLGVNCEYKDRYILWMGGGVVQKNSVFNDYFFWELIKRAKVEGYREVENWDANMKRLNRYKSKFDPSLGICYTISKKNLFSNVAQWTYGKVSDVSALNFVRKKIY